MKINESQSTVLQHASRPALQKENPDSAFQKVMEQTLSERDRKAEAPQTGQPGPVPDGIRIHGGAAAPDGAGTTAGAREVIETLQNALDLVDLYAARLADTSEPLSRLDPLIGHLEESMETLSHVGSKGELPGNLKPVVSDLLVTIGTEIARYRRGDYA